MIKSDRIILGEKALSGAWNDYIWETDPELAHLDAAPMITTSFSQYLSDYIRELRMPLPTSQRFALYTLEGKHIGNCSYYNMSETRGDVELGIMIGDRDYWDRGYGTNAIVALVDHIFNKTDFNRIYLKTLDLNIRARRCFEKCGFTSYGHLTRDGYSFVLMELYRDHWQSQKTDEV
jgi:RimJ/RimL family protein N-acetyltransferase